VDTLKRLVILLVGLVAGFAVGVLWTSRPRVKLDTPYQAVLLDSGLVYYGRIQGADTAFPVMTDVFYVQTQTNPQTKEVTNVLTRRGKEWHGPDKMILNRRHIMLIEPVSPDSKVAQLIAETKK